MLTEETMPNERWKADPEDQDFPAARSYLSLLVAPDKARKYARALAKEKDLWHYAAKDLLRTSGLPLLGADDPELRKDLEKVRTDVKLSPVLLVRGEPLWIADGYHRICASYHIDEDASIACRIVGRLA